MVFERGGVLIQYFRRALIDILQQVQNGIDKDCISFWLENLIDLFLEIGTSLPRWRTGFSGSSCSVNSSGKLPSI